MIKDLPRVRYLAFCLLVTTHASWPQEIPRGVGDWDSERFGNHRAVVEVNNRKDAVRVHIPWRRRDPNPDAKNIVVVDAASDQLVPNVVRLDIRRGFGDLVFQPQTAPGAYYVYFMPYETSGRSNYPTVTYPKPKDTADREWRRRHRLLPEDLVRRDWERLPRARVRELQSIDRFNSFWPMETIAAEAEVRSLAAQHPAAEFLLFPEDRRYPIRMTDDLPFRWIQSGPRSRFHGDALRGEFYAFQIGVYALRRKLEKLSVTFPRLERAAADATIAEANFRCIHLAGVDWTGQAFRRSVAVEQGKVQALWCGISVPEDATPGVYSGLVTVTPEGLEGRSFDFRLHVLPDRIDAHGDNEPWRHSRLRWLDSKLALDAEVVAPYPPVARDGSTLRILGREVRLAKNGFPERIVSFFAPEMTRISAKGRDVLSAPVELNVELAGGEALDWRSTGPGFLDWRAKGARFVYEPATGAAGWNSWSRAGPLDMYVWGQLEFDGNMEFAVRIRARETTDLGDIRLQIPMAADVARYMMGLGRKGGRRPREYDWKWDVSRNQDGAWIGDVNGGLQFSLKDENYSRPLNTNFYLSKPLVMPASWANSGKGGCRMNEVDDGRTFLVSCFSGPRRMVEGQELRFDFRLLLTPFRPIDPQSHFTTRFYHRFEPLEKIAKTGANVVNVHHATEINPFINYPFLRPDAMKAYVDEAHDRGMKVKIYYTVRELSTRAAELFALKSLGDEVFSEGPGGGFSWLQEHFGDNYIAGWLVPRIQDAAVVNSGTSRWHNYYLEGLNWLVSNIGIDGLYIDDVAFDRTVMKRLRKILDRGRDGALIDLHSANQFNPRDGFANSANLYLEHFPYLDRLWFGEYFDYDSAPDFWLVELSGIPFGVMGEMLQDGGHPWRGMLYGMTGRLPWAGDPRPLWRFWDDFGIEDSRMVGYWAPSAPVRTGRDDVLVTTYVGRGKSLAALASWAKERVEVRLAVDWKVLGIEPTAARMKAPAIEDFQEARVFRAAEPIPVDPGRGWLIVIATKN